MACEIVFDDAPGLSSDILRRAAGQELRDIHADPQRLRELVDATGRQTVPCLRISGEAGESRWVHESSDIIAYLRERFGEAR